MKRHENNYITNSYNVLYNSFFQLLLYDGKKSTALEIMKKLLK